jgi:hypothetical protein
MPGKRLFSPHSRKQDERMIVRSQENFYGGAFNDIPASTIAENAVSQYTDMVDFGKWLEGRGGNQRVSDTLLPSIENRGPYTATKTGTLITTTVNGDFTDDDIGNFFWWPDTRTYERIISVVDADNINVHTSTAHASTTTSTVSGDINALYYHKGIEKLVVHIGDEIYVADNELLVYTKCVRNCIDKPTKYKSMMDEYYNWVYLFTSNGTFKIDLNYDTPIYYKINSQIPSVKLGGSNSQSSSTPYCRRAVYTMGRLSGTGNTRDRNTDEVKIELESGSNKYTKTASDYAEYWTAEEVDGGNSVQVSVFTIPTDIATGEPQEHYTHYCYYCTLDVGIHGLDPIDGVINNTELYIWNSDIPVAKAFTLSQVGRDVSLIDGEIVAGDIGNTVEFDDGTTITIDTFVSPTAFITSTSQTKSGSGALGGGSVFTASQSGTTVTATVGNFSASDVGKRLYWANGHNNIVTAYTDSTHVEVSDSLTIASQGMTYSPTSRLWRDIVADDALRVRTAAWLLQTRFYQELPVCNIGVIVPGFMVCAQRNGSFVFYSEMARDFEYTAGYYYIASQFAHFKDSIEQLAEFPDKVIIYCDNSTHEITTNNYITDVLENVGIVITTIAGQNVIDHQIGLLGRGSLQDYDYGKQIMVTNDHGVRTFDGNQYSENKAEYKFMKKMLNMFSAFSSSYDNVNGYVLWGRTI